MEGQQDKLWKQILQKIETKVSRANFFTLFKNTSLLEIGDNQLTIAAPSSMVVNLLQKRFKDVFDEAITQETGKTFSLVFVAKTMEKPGKEKEVPLFTPERVAKSIGHLPRVRQDFTFETLAVSDSNRLAFESARTVAKNPGSSYNPLFIYGPVGVGKTHLMQAIANEVYAKLQDAKIIYITSEEFTNEVVEAIRFNDTARMKKKFRSANLLIIDDVQFIAGKDRVQEELFHTFNSLIDMGAQIALSSDRPPSEIKKLEARLSSRFAGGLTVDIEPPDFELRTAIILKKCEKIGINLNIDIAKKLAEKEQDVRSLEGMLLRISSQTNPSEIISQSVVEKALKNGDKDSDHIIHAEDIVEAICSSYNIKPTQLKGPKRDASLVKARQITMYLLKKELGLTLSEIGNLLGGRDHTTIMYGVDKIESLLLKNAHMSEEIVGITKSIRG